MEAIRPLRTLARRFILPVACFASVVWIAIFVVIYTHSPHPNVGLAGLIVLGGGALLLPWLGMAFAMLRRLRGNRARPAPGRQDTSNGILPTTSVAAHERSFESRTAPEDGKI